MSVSLHQRLVRMARAMDAELAGAAAHVKKCETCSVKDCPLRPLVALHCEEIRLRSMTVAGLIQLVVSLMTEAELAEAVSEESYAASETNFGRSPWRDADTCLN